MNVLFLSNSDGRTGGYAAAFRLLQGLEQLNVSAKMLVAENTRGYRSVVGPVSKWAKGGSLLRRSLDALPLMIYRRRERTIFSPAILPDGLSKRVASLRPDLVHLHWVAAGFMRIESLRSFRKPIVWTFHDMWAFTGGCHYDGSCGRYKDSCGVCPQLNSKRQNDLSHWGWKRKKKAWQDLNITIVTPSRWLAECAKTSSVLRNHRIEVIPYGLDTERYRPIDKRLTREMWGLPQNKKLILFGAMNASSDKRKGFQSLQPALQKLANSGWADRAELIVFGASEPAHPPQFGLKTHYMGILHDDISLALLYAAADVFVSPSIQDNLPNTIMESLSCGTPVVGFDVGGIPEMVEHQINGYLAKVMDTDDLARGIGWVLEDPERSRRLGKAARQKAEKEYSLVVQAQRYTDLYGKILERV